MRLGNGYFRGPPVRNRSHGVRTLLMSPRVVRRNGGDCLDEVARGTSNPIAHAADRSLFCGSARAPHLSRARRGLRASIANLPLFDLRDCIFQHGRESGGPNPVSTLKGYSADVTAFSPDVWNASFNSVGPS
ncbi:hypothetical protein H310_03341 [Aphanomyces invadans]|uniref:Uncharacterized protein n=1 Tax=Aphanomyces invadans TaxID=157072 RepID=A0A024UJ06_9STRA|nr:hypothetical protein H310_03341 [Aphanomyces invadans]ETW05603.1 hypothetical protein H310_03341 [Aphanomyces invadans]|eukprot:XP_008865380.1 hypothetical protein H310_03341 [Aphanomyces invadans]